MARVVVDPVTRIEGHLRIEAVVENGVITDAFSAGTMVRGLEKILIGRDPRDAWAITERVCGVCTTVHALTSVRAVESALGIAVPPTAELIRNIMMTTQYVQDHVIHFYHLHALDWVDIVNALKADPKKAAELAQSFSKWDKNTACVFLRGAGQDQGLCGQRTGNLCQRLLGPSGLQAAAGGEPDRRGALSGCAGVAEGDRQDPRGVWRQKSASELPCRRRPLLHQYE